MSKKTRNLTNKAGKLMKCDGKMLKKVIEAKGYKCHELSKMLRYCSDYLTTCCRTNKISDVAAKYLMDYKIFPQMYDLEGEIKVDEPKEVKIDKDDNLNAHDDALSRCLKKRMDMINRNSTYGIPKSDKDVELETGLWEIHSEKDLRDCIKRAISPNGPMPKSCLHLMDVSQLLKRARVNRVSYDVEDMRHDLLVYASNISANPGAWVEFVRHLSLRYNSYSRYSAQENRDHVSEAKEILNEMYGARNAYSGDCYTSDIDRHVNASRQIAAGLYHLIHAAMDDLKRDPEFKELIKQAVKEAYEEL